MLQKNLVGLYLRNDHGFDQILHVIKLEVNIVAFEIDDMVFEVSWFPS